MVLLYLKDVVKFTLYIMSKSWGESFWQTMYIIANNFPIKPNKDQQQHVITYYTVLADLLPCEECQQHYHNFLLQNPIGNFTDNKDMLLSWVNKLHDSVNEKLAKSKHITASGFGVRSAASSHPKFNRNGCSNCS